MSTPAVLRLNKTVAEGFRTSRIRRACARSSGACARAAASTVSCLDRGRDRRRVAASCAAGIVCRNRPAPARLLHWNNSPRRDLSRQNETTVVVLTGTGLKAAATVPLTSRAVVAGERSLYPPLEGSIARSASGWGDLHTGSALGGEITSPVSRRDAPASRPSLQGEGEARLTPPNHSRACTQARTSASNWRAAPPPTSCAVMPGFMRGS